MKRLVIMLIAAVLVGLVLAPASTVMAASGTRSLPSSVTGGATFDVDINTADYGAFGQVVETLPAGFSYVSTTLSAAAVTVDGQVVKFTLLGDTSFSYTVTASSTAGSYAFSGILKDEDKVEFPVGGDVQITVPATRNLPSSVSTGANFNVSINTADYGAFGQVVETLPAGFSYVSTTLSAAAVTVDGQVVKFTLLGDTSFSYTVRASGTAGSYAFSGILKDEDKVEFPVGGEAEITVTAPAPVYVGGGGARAAPPTIDTNLFGVEWSSRISDEGKILTTITATSADGMLTIRIPVGTIALDKYGNPLGSLEAAVDESPPDPPEDANIIGLAYDFGPEGATFDPAITLEYTYDPAEVPEAVAEGDLVMAWYDHAIGEWVECECTCDPETHCITACVCHFTCFAIITPPVPAPPPPPPPVPAVFSLSDLSVKPAEVEPKEAVTITVSVANTGGTEGSYTVVLMINGVKEAEKSVTVVAGSSQDVSFSVTRKDAGSYSVVVDGLSGSFAVIAPPAPPAPPEVKPPVVPPVKPPVNWPLIGGIIAAVVVVGLLIFFLVRRRA